MPQPVNTYREVDYKNSIAALRPNLTKMWHPTKNGTLDPTILGNSSRIITYFLCSQGHDWGYSLSDFKSENCLVCVNKIVIEGINDLTTTSPDLAKMWDYETNSILPTTLHAGSSTPVFWKCEKSHPFDSAPKSTFGCPICSNRRTVSGINDLATTNPEVLKAWDYSKNILDPTTINAGAKQTAWWICPNGHSHQKSIRTQVSGEYGCNYCYNRGVLEGFNDLASQYPELTKQYHSSNRLPPNQIHSGGHDSITWECIKGHTWETEVRHRTVNNYDCPTCANLRLLVGYNDLLSQYPIQAKMWNTSKNGMKADEIGYYSSMKSFWWDCPNGHSYRAKVFTQTVDNRGCPHCQKANTSKIEGALREQLRANRILQNVTISHKNRIQVKYPKLRYCQIDILGEYSGKKVIIEYDGYRWHTNPQKDIENTKAFIKEGYIVIRVREQKLSHLAYKNKNFFQISYKWSLNTVNVLALANDIENIVRQS